MIEYEEIGDTISRLDIEIDDLHKDLLTLLNFLSYSLGYANQAFNSYDVLSKTEAWAMLEKYESLREQWRSTRK